LPAISTWCPPGEGWSSAPFEPELRGGLLHGRGAVDMKGGIAAFVAACADIPDHAGTLSLIITGDEEGPATYGTPKLIEWMADAQYPPGHDPDRRADLGGAARRHRQDRPARLGQHVDQHPRHPGPCRLPPSRRQSGAEAGEVIDALEAIRLDDGSESFQPSNLEITAVETSSKATNVIPGFARAQLNIRFNNLHRGEDLVALVRRTAEEAAPGATVEARIRAKPS
jgi:succinyl-diaminopimelate desuccinylase